MSTTTTTTTTQILNHIRTNWGRTSYVSQMARELGQPREVIRAELHLLQARGAVEFDGVWATLPNGKVA